MKRFRACNKKVSSSFLKKGPKNFCYVLVAVLERGIQLDPAILSFLSAARLNIIFLAHFSKKERLP
jgi:hypothetical protein